MLSLDILTVYLGGSLVLSAGAITVAAGWSGSSRATIGVGMLAEAFIIAVNAVVSAILAGVISVDRPVPQVIAGVLALVVQGAVAFVVLGRMFRLSFIRTLGPFAAHVAASIVVLAVGVGVVRPFLTESFVIPSSNMHPTLEPGDCFMVNKLITPRRWDLVAHWTRDADPQPVCQRLVGLPGEQLRLENGTLFVNGQTVTVPSVVAGRYHAAPTGASADLVRYNDGETITLGPDEYFFIGDNVDRSLDSRLQGPSDRSTLLGVVDLIYWPPARMRILR